MQVPQYVSVILTTYNQPEWLTKVLWGYACQTHRDFEIVIADDGSDDRTIEAIDHIRNQTDLKIEHVWHADDQSRKSVILNQAIVRASGDYLLFSDGDCVPRNTFVANHCRFARHDSFLSGGYFALPESISQSLTVDDICTGRAFQWKFLRSQGLRWSRRYLRFVAGRYFASVLNRMTTTRPTWNGSNCSGWKDDVLSVNGFDERMKYGALDRELGERLENAGVHGRHIRYSTVVLQLDHPPRDDAEEDWAMNDQIRQAVHEERRTWTDYGIRKTIGEVTEQLRRAA
ncbi:MAG: glycosyltransferase [Planctomycetaceae bacterium]